MYQDKALVARMRSRFVFTAGEQEFYAAKGFGTGQVVVLPAAARKQRNSGNVRTPDRCSCASGAETQVPPNPAVKNQYIAGIAKPLKK